MQEQMSKRFQLHFTNIHLWFLRSPHFDYKAQYHLFSKWIQTTYLSSSHPVAHKADTRPFHLFLSAAIFSASFQVFPIFFRSPSIVLLQVSLGLPRLLFPSAGVHLNAVFVMDWFPFLKTWPSHLNWNEYRVNHKLLLCEVFNIHMRKWVIRKWFISLCNFGRRDMGHSTCPAPLTCLQGI